MKRSFETWAPLLSAAFTAGAGSDNLEFVARLLVQKLAAPIECAIGNCAGKRTKVLNTVERRRCDSFSKTRGRWRKPPFSRRRKHQFSG